MIEVRWLEPAPLDEPVLTGLLDEAERARAQRFHHPADRLAYVAAHALLRTLLSEVGEGAPQAWRFVRSPTGKPRLDEAGRRPDLRFSLSHTRGMVACAVAAGVELGVDVEPLTPMPDALPLARAYFASAEADGLQTLAEPARSEAFLHLWTLKEAAHKASGEGLQTRIDHPQFDPSLIAGSTDIPVPVHPADWRFRCFRPAGRFVMSLATPVGDGSRPVRCHGLDVRGGALMARRMEHTAQAVG